MGNHVPGTSLVSDPPVVSRANPSMGLETTNPATLTILPTPLGALAGVAVTVLCWPNEQLVFYRIDKLDGLVVGHRPVAPGTRHTNSPGFARGRPEHVRRGHVLGGTTYFLFALLRFPLLPIRGIVRRARFPRRAEPKTARLCLLCVYDRYEFCGLRRGSNQLKDATECPRAPDTRVFLKRGDLEPDDQTSR